MAGENKNSEKPDQGRLIVLCGLPGSGKTTLAQQLQTTSGGMRLCPDEWMEAAGVSLYDSEVRSQLEVVQWEMAKNALAHGRTVIVEWGSWSREERDVLREGARKLGAKVELWYLEVPPKELWRRVSERGQEDPPLRREDLDGWYQALDVPDENELALYDTNTQPYI